MDEPREYYTKSDLKRQVLYDMTYSIWKLKIIQVNLYMKQKKDSQIQKTNMVPKGEDKGRNKLELWD